MVAKTIILTLIIFTVMIGIAVAEGDKTYGMMIGNCTDCGDCIDVVHAFENLPFAQFEELSAFATTSTGITIEKKWAYGRRNEVPKGMLHVYYDFEEGNNLFPFNNVHPGVTSFENVSDSYCCWPCSDNNEPSYVRQGASSGPTCRCVMYIYPTPRTFSNGTDIPYIHIVNGNAAFTPRVLSGWCYYPACSAFIGFKDGTNYVSFLASTSNNLNVRAYDKQGKYLGGTTIYYTTDRIGDGPSNFTRFTMHLPDTAIGYLTFDGPFNGWHIDDLVVGDTPGYLPDEGRRDYGWAAERMRELIGAKYHPLGLGYLLHSGRLLTAAEIKDFEADPYYNPFNKEMEFGEGICPEAAIIWAFNEDSNLINSLYMNDQFKKDFKVDIAYEDVQPGDVFFIDYSPADGQYDEVGMYIGSVGYDPVLECDIDIIRIVLGGGVHLSSSDHVNRLYDVLDGFVYYRSLPDKPRGTKSPYPKPPGKPI